VPYTLLLADDSVTIQRVIELTFADQDVQVTAVSDGDQAIARIEAAPPDIVLADVGMPGKNGYEVAQHVKESPRLAHIPVILLTGAFEPVDQAKAAAAGCAGVLAKPFEPQMVIARVRELLAKPRSAPEPEPKPAASQSSSGSWPPPASQTAPAPSDRTPAATDLDQYFDQLDAAFASLPGTSRGPASPDVARSASANEDLDIDWFGTSGADAPEETAAKGEAVPPAAVPPDDLPLSYGSPLSDFDRVPQPPSPSPSSSPAAPSQRPAVMPPYPSENPTDETSPAAPPAFEQAQGPRDSGPPYAVAPPSALPTIADAFAALLAAEQGFPPSSAAPAWPSIAPAAAPAITDDVVDAVTKRVLEQMSDRVVRETVSGIVSAIAERLVREEIERIKASLK
jgi:CheY-like chemotaxis protein